MPPRPTPPPPGVLATLREALRGGHRDFTEGPVGRAVVLLAIPMVLEMALESVFAVVDVFWVSKLGAAAVATVGLTESILSLLYALAIGLSMAATAMVARRIGERDRERAARTAVQAIALGVLVAVPLGVAGALLAPRLLALMGAGPAVVASGSTFMAVMLGGNVVIVLLFLINAIFRGAGDATVAMRVLWFANVCNIVLGPCFIFGLGPFPALGVTGAAVATTTGAGSVPPARDARRGRGASRSDGASRARPKTMFALRGLGRRSRPVLIGTASWIGSCASSRASGARRSRATIAIRSSSSALLPSWDVERRRDPRRPEPRGEGSSARRAPCSRGRVQHGLPRRRRPRVRRDPRRAVGLFTQDLAIAPVATEGLRIIAAGFLHAWGWCS